MIGNVVMSARVLGGPVWIMFDERGKRRSNATTCNDKVVVFAHAPRRLDDFFFIIPNHLHALERHAE
jgi:hypothetical protein